MPEQPWHPHVLDLGPARRVMSIDRPRDSRFAWMCSPDAPVTTAEALELATLIREDRNG